MSRTATRTTPCRDAPPGDPLTRLLDSPDLSRVVPALPPEALAGIIRHHGLAACGELVAATTPPQLTALLDLDLWRRALPGRDDQFDVDRFGEWIEVLVDTGPALAARTVARLDAALVVAGLSRYVRVFDPGIFEPIAQSDDERAPRHEAMREGDAAGADMATDADAGSGATPADEGDREPLECELGGYLVRARRADAWDAIVSLLAALDTDHGDAFHALMQGCRRLSNSRPEADGLDDLAGAPNQHLYDVGALREARLAQQGYATPADARAFLRMARRPIAGEAPAAAWTSGAHPIAAAYFRAMEAEPSSDPDPTSDPPPDPSPTSSVPSATDRQEDSRGDADLGDAVADLLAEAGMMPERPRALLESAEPGPPASRLSRLRRLMAHARDTDDAAHLALGRELAFLANILLAGASVQSRPFTPQEASDAAACVCNLGLESWPGRWADVAAASRAQPGHPSLVTAFEVGWSVLHHEVGLAVAARLAAILADVRPADSALQRDLATLRRRLADGLEAGTPWLARPASEVLAELDIAASIGLQGLLEECPIVPAAMTAILDGRASSISPTAFDFVATRGQIDEVHAFMARLPDLLSR
ncbi:MAG: DUF6178 family protein [Vicinamibacterales bacterium]